MKEIKITDIVETSGGLKVGAVVGLNALGDVFDYRTGKQIAGLLSEDKRELRSTRDFGNIWSGCDE